MLPARGVGSEARARLQACCAPPAIPAPRRPLATTRKPALRVLAPQVAHLPRDAWGRAGIFALEASRRGQLSLVSTGSLLGIAAPSGCGLRELVN